MASGERTGFFAITVTRLAGLWILAGALLKLFVGRPEDLPQLVQDLPLELGLTYRLAIAAEMAIALLALLKPRWAWLLLILLLLMFDVVLVTQVLDQQPSCGCFGSKFPVSPVVVLAVDTALLLLLLVSRPWATPGSDATAPIVLTAVLGLAAALPWVFDREVKGPGEHGLIGTPYVVLDPETWVGSRLADTNLAPWIDLDALPRDGLWIFYSDTCEVCAELLEYMVSIEVGMRPLVLLRVPDADGGEPKIHSMPTGSFVHGVTLSDDVGSWGITPPAGLVLRDGCVVWAKESMTWEHHGATTAPDLPDACR